jgi:hypothetical protein
MAAGTTTIPSVRVQPILASRNCTSWIVVVGGTGTDDG